MEAEVAVSTNTGFDISRVRQDFPVLAQEVHGHPLVYLDNAATGQKPQSVIDAVAEYYAHDNANVHRGVHALSQRATDAYEGAREKVRRFLNASKPAEVIFTKGTTDGLNLVASTVGRSRITQGDEVIVSAMEHHSNIVPWQLICEERGATVRVIPMNQAGELDMQAFADLLSDRTRVVSVGHISNALGTVNPIAEIVKLAHAHGALVAVDGAQAAPHSTIDVQALGVDFYAISSHKMFGPTGIGALYGRLDLLEDLPPYQGGGDMIKSVSFSGSEFAEPPSKFEAGTPNIAGAVGFGVAVDYLMGLDWDAVEAHEADVLRYGAEHLADRNWIKPVGTARNKAGVMSFLVDGVHAHDVGTIVDLEGVAIRTGHHCAQPVMEFYGVAATARASIAFYNTREDIDALMAALEKVREVFG